MMAVVHIIATRRNMPQGGAGAAARVAAGAVFRGALPLSMPIVLLGGIYSGVFTPTEAAAVAAACMR
jgi:C4-dicarboxylate transporter DctM subunit